MATTPKQAWPIPDPTDLRGNVPLYLQNLGSAIEKQSVMRYATSTTRDASLTVPEEGMLAYLTTPDQLTLYTNGLWRVVYEPWTSYVVTLSGWTVGNGVLVGFYQRVGATVLFQISFTLGSTSTTGAVEPVFSLPFLPKTGFGLWMRTTCTSLLFDATGGSHCAPAYTTGTNNEFIRPMIVNAASTYGVNATITGTVPFTWAVNDVLIISGWYPLS